MKLIVTIFVFLNCTQVIANEDFDNLLDRLNSQVVDSILYSHQSNLSQIDFNIIPESLKCSNGKEFEIDLVNLKTLSPGISHGDYIQEITLKSDEHKSGLVLDWTDGDQVGGLFVTMSSLDSLTHGTTKIIPAKIYNGYWWADGDHYSLIDATCVLK